MGQHANVEEKKELQLVILLHRQLLLNKLLKMLMILSLKKMKGLLSRKMTIFSMLLKKQRGKLRKIQLLILKKLPTKKKTLTVKFMLLERQLIL